MREIKFRAWDGKLQSYHYWDSITQANDNVFWSMTKSENMTVEIFTGFFIDDKEVYVNDSIVIRTPERLTQTHTGENIPNGSYTEPLEAGIVEREYMIEFSNGQMVGVNDNLGHIPLFYLLDFAWDADSIKGNVSNWGKPGRFIWDSGDNKDEFGDLQSLYEDAGCETMEELIIYLSVIAHENQELPTPKKT